MAVDWHKDLARARQTVFFFFLGPQGGLQDIQVLPSAQSPEGCRTLLYTQELATAQEATGICTADIGDPGHRADLAGSRLPSHPLTGSERGGAWLSGGGTRF